MQARLAPDLREILHRAALVVADGVGVVWGARQLGRLLPGRVPGIDLAGRLCDEALRRRWRVCLVGGAPGVADAAAANLRLRHPGIDVRRALPGYFGPEDDPAVVRAVRDAAPTLLLAGLGSPRQERWLHRHLASLGAPVAIGVGGTLDVWAGRARRLARPLARAAAMIAVPEAAPRGINSEEEFPNGPLNRGRHPAGIVAATAATEGADAAWGKCSESPPIRSRRPWQEPSPP